MKRLRSGSWRSTSTARAVDQAEVADIGRDAHRRHRVEHPVEPAGRDALGRGVGSCARCARRRRCRSPRASASMNGSISSGGSCRSMSIGITMSPRAWSMPAVSAASLPKLRDRLTTLMRRSRALRSSRWASVLSREPSFTKTISKRKPARSSSGSTASRKRSINSSSLNTGTTSDSSGSAGRRARWPASWRSRALP